MKIHTNNTTNNVNNPFKSIIDSMPERHDTVLENLSLYLSIDIRTLKLHYAGSLKTLDISLAVAVSKCLNAWHGHKLLEKITLETWGSGNDTKKIKKAKDYTKLFIAANAIG